MNFDYSDEQQQLADSLQKYLSQNYGFEQRKAASAIEVPYGVAISLGTFWVVPQMASAITLPMPF